MIRDGGDKLWERRGPLPRWALSLRVWKEAVGTKP